MGLFLVPFGVLAVVLWVWGDHNLMWGSDLHWVAGLLALFVVAAAYRDWRGRRAERLARERALLLLMAEDLAVLRLADGGAVEHPAPWAVQLLGRASELADKDVARLFAPVPDFDDDPRTADEIEADKAQWHRKYERDYRVALVRQRAEAALGDEAYSVSDLATLGVLMRTVARKGR